MFRDPDRKLESRMAWALCVSLVLHLSVLGASLTPGRSAKVRGEGGVSLPISVLLPGRGQTYQLESGMALGEGNAAVVDRDTQKPGQREFGPADSVEYSSRGRDGLFEIAPTVQEPSASAPDTPAPSIPSEGHKYFRRSELTIPPSLDSGSLVGSLEGLGKLEPIGGKFTLRLYISTTGDVSRAEIDKSAALNAYEEASVDGFRSLHFRPGEIDGIAVSSQVVFEIDFDILPPGLSRSSDRGQRWDDPERPKKRAAELRDRSIYSSSILGGQRPADAKTPQP